MREQIISETVLKKLKLKLTVQKLLLESTIIIVHLLLLANGDIFRRDKVSLLYYVLSCLSPAYAFARTTLKSIYMFLVVMVYPSILRIEYGENFLLCELSRRHNRI